jgi:hypothetical protein
MIIAKEIKNELISIMKQVYVIPEDRAITEKQDEFLEKWVNFLQINYTVRRRKESKKGEVEND